MEWWFLQQTNKKAKKKKKKKKKKHRSFPYTSIWDFKHNYHLGDHSLSAYAKFSGKKLTFLPPDPHKVFRKILREY